MLMNEALGNVGETVRYTVDPDPERPPYVETIGALAGELEAGAVDTLLVLGGNPAYDAPADLELPAKLARAETTIHLSTYRNETSDICNWHLPRAHFLESWGDARAFDGALGAIQPLIEPLYGGRSTPELLALLLGDPVASGHALVRDTFSRQGVSEDAWRRVLHDGIQPGTEFKEVRPSIRLESWTEGLKAYLRTREETTPGRLELVFHPGYSVYDGRFANNGWLQELPDSMTKLTWDNAALIAPSTAEALGVGQGDLVRVEQYGRSVDLPVYLMPGQAAGSISVQLGYGRRRCGRVGEGVGFDVYPLRTTEAMNWLEVAASPAGGNYPLSTTQDHFAIDALGARERADRIAVLVREVDLEEYRLDPEGAMHAGHEAKEVELWEPPATYDDGYRWGMAIDMNACVGCNACVTACQSENNIPVVGKDEVGRGREMHWIRVDRYFAGPTESPSVTHQPVTCQHCENAPCEQVCPVAATVHDSEGLNLMVYNRCVGTRYCANNCPYKVRRFNYFNNHKHESAIEAMVYNPDVSVRSRGVMEKCTFCVQRISAAKIEAKNNGREVRDGEVRTACEQACPTRAITFGNLNDPQSRVAKKQHDPRAYAMLSEWNVQPRNRFLARVRNAGRRRTPGATG
jgi:molybdopterin-containing oxidoreductase family iron-sulfur binding subunit